MKSKSEISRLQEKLGWYKACVKEQAKRIRQLEQENRNLKAKLAGTN